MSSIKTRLTKLEAKSGNDDRLKYWAVIRHLVCPKCKYSPARRMWNVLNKDNKIIIDPDETEQAFIDRVKAALSVPGKIASIVADDGKDHSQCRYQHLQAG
jgi:hypothetical protein